MNLLESLNPEQQQAVSSSAPNLRILAGAGSGKTRVLVHRIAWLLMKQLAFSHEIMAVTFTNKAANEMRQRVEALLQCPTQRMWVGTFHGLAHRLLRTHFEQANLPDTFQILDSEDQYRLIRRLQKTLNLDEEKCPPKQSQKFINQQKEKGLRARHMDSDQYGWEMVDLYQAYEDTCQNAGLVDFTELLLRAHELLRNHAELLAVYSERFKYILVDEFQDTNTLQYAWIRLLGKSSSVLIVGDDDQSIYSWRGAQIDNLQRFANDFPGVETIRLEKNYRSTQTILSAANAVIAFNTGRLGKNLWTDDQEGKPILLYNAFNELDEAQYIASQIQQWALDGNARRDAAILYRANAQSRVLEEALRHAEIPYQIYGGLKFFDRAEIKDALAYLRLQNNRNDDAAFERIVNTPTRGIGHTTLDKVRLYAREHDQTLWQATHCMIEHKLLSARASQSLQSFIQLIANLAEHAKNQSLDEQLEATLEQSGLLLSFQQDRSEKGQSRLENLEELVTATRQFISNEEQLSPLAEFLSYAALESAESKSHDTDDCVQMMTLHSAKGLEFEFVTMAGLEEGLFPHQMSIDSPERLEEERRLCYVGMTRAKQQLMLTYTESRHLNGRIRYHQPSRFIREIPQELIAPIRLGALNAIPTTPHRKQTVSIESTPYKLGQLVKHAKFGDGVVVNFEGGGEHARIQVNFHQHGLKWLVNAYANLEILS